MHELRGRQIQCDYGGDELLFMLGRNLLSLDWIKHMHRMLCGVILRHDWSFGSVWIMCCR